MFRSDYKAEVVNHVGDLSVVNAARASFAKQQTEVTEKDHGLIKYLHKHKHFTCFTHTRWTFEIPVHVFKIDRLTPELMMGLVFKRLGNSYFIRHSMWGWKDLINLGLIADRGCMDLIKATFKLLAPLTGEAFFGKLPDDLPAINFSIAGTHPSIKADRWFHDVSMLEEYSFFIARQRFKHMVGFTYNETSRRYVKTTPDVYEFPELSRVPDGSIKQGAGEKHEVSMPYRVYMKDLAKDCVALYDNMIAGEFAPEQVRSILPMGTYTSVYVTGSIAAWDRFYELRLEEHAQKEIRDFAQVSLDSMQAST